MRLNKEMARAALRKNLRDSLAAQGGDPAASTPAEFGACFKAEINRYAAVVREAGITAE